MADQKMAIGLAASRYTLRQSGILHAAFDKGGLTIEQVAHLSGVKPRKIRKILLGRQPPTGLEFSALLAALGFELSLNAVKMGEITKAESEKRAPHPIILTPLDNYLANTPKKR